MELQPILEKIDDPIEAIIVAMGCIAIRLVMYPMEMMFSGDSQ